MKKNTRLIDNSKKTVAWLARTMPPHFGHLYYLLTLFDKFEKVVIVIGSCYEHGETRFSISAYLREKMLRAMLEEAHVSKEKYDFEHLPDYKEDEVWYNELMNICKKNNVSCIATGNEWVQDIVKKHGGNIEVKDFEIKYPFKYRATDVRNAIIDNDFEAVKKMVPFSVLQILLTNDCFKSILLSNMHNAVHFVPGRQTVDMVILLKDPNTDKLYVLLGKRDKKKQDFPGVFALPGGAIETFESPEKAIVRIVRKETGLLLKVLDESFLQPPVSFENIDTKLTTMKKVGIYSSEDVLVAGTRGGSSQCFSILIEDEVEKFRNALKQDEDLYDLDFYEISNIRNKFLAFQHSEMLEKAMFISKAMPKIEVDRKKKNKKSICISLIGSSGARKSTAAYGIMYNLKRIPIDVEMASEFAKDEVYENHLQEILEDQLYIIGNQNRRVARLVGKVDYIITDAPLPICSAHTDDELLKDIIFSTFDKTENYIIFLKRPDEEKFCQEGRIEDADTSKKISDELEKSLVLRGYDLDYAYSPNETVILALKFVYNRQTDEKIKERILEFIEQVKNEKV